MAPGSDVQAEPLADEAAAAGYVDGPTLGELAELRLARAVARLASRFASVLAQAAPARKGPLGDFVAFLSGIAERWSAGEDPSVTHPGLALPLDRVVEALQLPAFEQDLVLIGGLPDEHEGFADVLRSLHPRGEPRPTVALAAQLLCHDGAERRILQETLFGGAAVRSGLLRLGDDGPLPERNLLLADSIWPVLRGLDRWPSSLHPTWGPVVLSGLETWLERAEVARAAIARGEPVTVMVLADTEDVAVHRAAALAALAGVPAVRLRFTPDPNGDLERLAQLHTAARGVVPIIRLQLPDGPGVFETPGFAGQPGPVILCGRHGSPAPRGLRPVLPLPADSMRPSERSRMWREALPELGEHAPRLATRYPVEPALAVEVAADVRAAAALEGRAATLDDIAASVRVRSAPSVASGIKVVRPTAPWNKLVLRPERKAQLREGVDRLLGQVRVLDEWRFLDGRPGARGVRMLFAGPSGTGKTLSAEVLAHTLGVDLLIVDISRVVSKWIGETEKNLSQVFDAAERSTAVLLFDEADALFGKRTEVSDAHDRYANLETAYLLSRLERFEGLAILSTNLRSNIDVAFLRRLEFVIDFEEPDLPQREELWRAHVPPSAPLTENVNFYHLAALYPVVGAWIRNAAVAAAFLAAAEERPIAQSHFVHAMQREYEKSGRAFPGSPLGMPGIKAIKASKEKS